MNQNPTRLKFRNIFALLALVTALSQFSGLTLFSPVLPSAFAEGETTAPAVPADSTAVPAGEAAQGQVPGQPGIFGMLFPFILMFGVLYFLMIRPQQKKMREHGELLNSLKNGDEVVTSAGIIGTVAGLTEKVVTLEVANNVKIKVLKPQVTQVIKGSI